MKDTKIEWCDHSWSPWRGCTKVSAGCANCYAETLSKRNPAVFGEWGKGKPRVINKNWNEPLKWNKNPFVSDHTWVPGLPNHLRKTHRARIFPSLCDWLDEEVPAELRARFMQLTRDTLNLDWLLLTKRPEKWAGLIEDAARWAAQNVEFEKFEPARKMCDDWLCSDGRFAGFPHIQPPSNVWVGTSVEDQPNADRRSPEWLKIPAKVRFLSVEPLLGPIVLPLTGIHWVIVGGESGPNARMCNVDWIRDIVRQCATAKVPCFVKQLGAVPVYTAAGRDFTSIDGLGNVRAHWSDPGWFIPWNSAHNNAPKITHPKGGDPAEWPEDLRVRQMPEVVP